MPNFPCSGILTDVDGNLYENVFVSLKNLTTDEWIKSEGVVQTNSFGEYIIEASNCPSGFSDGDVILVTYFLGAKQATHEFTIDTSIGSEEFDTQVLEIPSYATFTIKPIIDEVGGYFLFYAITYSITGERTESETSVKYTIKGHIQVIDGSEEGFSEGTLEKEDLIIWVDNNETNIDQLKIGLKADKIEIEWNARKYKVVNFIENPGHLELQAKKT